MPRRDPVRSTRGGSGRGAQRSPPVNAVAVSPEASAHGAALATSVTAPSPLAGNEVRRCEARPGGAEVAVEGLPIRNLDRWLNPPEWVDAPIPDYPRRRFPIGAQRRAGVDGEKTVP